MKRSALLMFAALIIARAQDQQITIDTKPCLLSPTELPGIDEEKATLDPGTAGNNIDKILSKIRGCLSQQSARSSDVKPWATLQTTTEAASGNAAAATTDEKGVSGIAKVSKKTSETQSGRIQDRFYIVHVLRYKDRETTVETSKWYVYHQPWTKSREWTEIPMRSSLEAFFRNKRIFGSPAVSLVYIHLNIPGVLPASTASLVSSARSENPDDKAAVDDLEKLIKGEKVNRTFQATTGHTLNAYFGGLVAKGSTDILYKVSVKKKLPSNVQNVLDALGAVQNADPAMKPLKIPSLAVCNVYDMEIAHVPSDMTVTGFRGVGADGKELEKQTFDNEGRHWWDVSVALPLKTWKGVDYSAENNTVSARKIERQNLFATFNLYVPPTDTKRVNFRWFPHLMYGLPIQGKVLQRHLLAAGLGLNRVEAFVGVTFDRTSVPGAVGSGQLNDRWVRKLAVGINIPLRSALDALKPPKEGNK